MIKMPRTNFRKSEFDGGRKLYYIRIGGISKQELDTLEDALKDLDIEWEVEENTLRGD